MLIDFFDKLEELMNCANINGITEEALEEFEEEDEEEE